MRPRELVTTTALLLGAVGVGAYLWFIEPRKQTTGELDRRKSNLIKLYRPEALTEIVIEREGKRGRLIRTTAEPDAGEGHLWKLEAEGKTEVADQFAVDKVLSALEYAYP